MEKNIYKYIVQEEANYKLPVHIADGYDWSMYNHIKTTVLYKDSIFTTGQDENKPFKNIIRPILNLHYRAEGFDVKDIILFINDSYKYFKSFLVRKFHEKWARENQIDTFIDELVETWVDFGGVLVKDTNDIKPEVVPWPRIAFVDQTDILSGPICEKHYFSPDQLKEMESRGWKDIDKAIVLAREGEEGKTLDSQSGQKAKTPGRYIGVYELHGVFPRYWLYDRDEDGNYMGKYLDEESKDEEYVRQVHICALYKDKEGQKNGITLYKAKENKLPYKLSLRHKRFGRGLGLGGAEELFENQVWINYSQIRIKQMLDAASKIIFQTTDAGYANRNKIQGMDNLEITVVEDNKRIDQIDTRPLNINLFDNSIREWEQHARQMGAATESILGESPSAGTPFKLQELITAESHSLHEYRKGILATFVEEIYRDWTLAKIVKKITHEQEFLAELDLEEMQAIADSLVRVEVNDQIKEKILNGEVIFPDEIEVLKQTIREEFMRTGNKKFIKILEGEMKGAEVDLEINIVGKQKDLAGMVDKLTNVFRTIVSNPAVLQSPPMAKLFNQILESSGLSPIDFSGFTVPQPMQEIGTEGTKPLTQLAERPTVAQQIGNR